MPNDSTQYTCREFIDALASSAPAPGGGGAAILKSALMSASLNVFINTRTLRDRERADALNAEANAMLEKYCAMADQVFDAVRAALI